MNTFKRKALASAVLGTLGVAGSAHAIYQDPSGLGQALVYPYYTVNSDPVGNPFNTLISVVNTTTTVKIVKVRFHEGKASKEVLDFNIYLSPNDMWTAAVIPASADASSPAHIVTADKSCTNPVIAASGQDFLNYDYVGTNADPLATTLDRTREGYIEMFEMAVISQPSQAASAATHGSSGAPTCAGLSGSNLALTAVLLPPTGGLAGTGTIINILSGRDTMYNARAFGAWSNVSNYDDTGRPTPNFSQTSPSASITVDPSIGAVFFGSWSDVVATTFTATAGVRAASATMMHTDVINEYVLDSATNSNTDWVFTFPTKRYFVDDSTAVTPFSAPLTANGACEVISLTYFNREEASAVAGPNNGVFSPTAPGSPPSSLCWESTVLSVRNGSSNAPASPSVPSLVLGSQNTKAVTVTSTFQNGWMDVHFAGTAATTTGLASDATSLTSVNGAAGVAGSFTYLGLPVVGFMVRTFTNGALSCAGATCQGNYLGLSNHAFLTTP
jgi:hypothetical protein